MKYQGYDDVMKTAGIFQEEPGTNEKYMPWYGAAGLGALGTAAGAKLPGKWKLPGKVLGALLGTAAGVHGGEAIGKKVDQWQ